MLHIYRQVSCLSRYETFVVTKQRQCEDAFPFDPVVTAPDVKSNFVRRFWLKYIKKEPPIVYRGEYGVLNSVLERNEADMMHVYFGHTGVHLLPFIQRWPKPTIVSFHGMDVQPRHNKPGYLDHLKSLLKTLPLVMARSDSLKQRLIELGCDEGKIRLNRTGIPMDQFPFIERAVPVDGAWHFVQACRLVEKKGLFVSLDAFARFLHFFPKARFTIAGEGPLEAEVREYIKEKGLENSVSLAGFLRENDLCKLYHDAHIFLHPSQLTADQNQEGIPNSMLEAMATGLPTLATFHGGIPEAVKNEVTGLLVPERDTQGLYQHMMMLAKETDRWRSLGDASGIDMRNSFEHGAQIAKLEGFYDELLEHHGQKNS